MAGVKQPTPREVFDEAIADAERLLAFSRALTNKRQYRLRKEMRVAVAPALEKLRVPKAEWDYIDGIESDDLFVLLLPDAGLDREDFRDHSTLLRGALIAACSAFETFLSGWAIARIRKIGKKGLPAKAQKITLTVEKWTEIRGSKYPARALNDRVFAPYLQELASTAPNKVGEVLATVGIEKPIQKLDGLRHTTKGTTEAELDEITKRRNRIAHAADREGRRKATMSAAQTEEYLATLVSIVDAIEKL